MTTRTDTAPYRDVAIFANLRDEEIADLIEGAERVEVAPGTTVIREGDPPEAFYILEKGRCAVRRVSEGGRTVDLATLVPTAAFGEMALLANRPRSASVVAVEPSVLLRISRERFDRFIEEGHPSISKVILNMARVLCDRVESVNRQFAQLVDKASAAPNKTSKELQTFKEQLYNEWAF